MSAFGGKADIATGLGLIGLPTRRRKQRQAAQLPQRSDDCRFCPRYRFVVCSSPEGALTFAFRDKCANRAPPFDNLHVLDVLFVDPAAIIASAQYSAPDQTPRDRPSGHGDSPNVPDVKRGTKATVCGQRLRGVSIFCKRAKHGALKIQPPFQVNRWLHRHNRIPNLPLRRNLNRPAIRKS
jgi:hypothetical protein